MRRVSRRRQALEQKYKKASSDYKASIGFAIARGEAFAHCPVAYTLWGEKLPREDIHHTCGRGGDDLWDKNTFMWISRKAHEWIGANGREAEQRGWLNPRRHLPRDKRLQLENK